MMDSPVVDGLPSWTGSPGDYPGWIPNVKSLPSLLRNSRHFDTVKEYLERDSSTVNKSIRGRYQALHYVLQDDYCKRQAELVKLLIDYGADVNPTENCPYPPLRTALVYCDDPEVIRVLLEAGADIHTIFKGYFSLLCDTLHRERWNRDAVKMMLDFTDISKIWCRDHDTLLQCYVQGDPYRRLRTDVAELLIENSTHVQKKRSFPYSTFCYALKTDYYCEPSLLELLLKEGFHNCLQHSHPFHCYVLSRRNVKLKYLSLFLKKGVADFTNAWYKGCTPLHFLLEKRKYELDVLKVLLEHEGVDVNLKNNLGRTFLACAVLNDFVNPCAVALLIKKGARVDEPDNKGCTPLHYAVVGGKPSLVRILVKNGSHVNCSNREGRTPFEMAIKLNSDLNPNVIKLLFKAGVRFSGYHILFINYLLLGMENVPNRRKLKRDYGKKLLAYKNYRQSFELILRYSLLENPNCYVKTCSWMVCDHVFVQGCISESQCMRSTLISKSVTFEKFVTQYPRSEMCDAEFDTLLSLISKFPLYSEIILSVVERSFMENKLHSLMDHVKISSIHYSGLVAKDVTLGRYCVNHIVTFLPKRDFGNLLIALIPEK